MSGTPQVACPICGESNLLPSITFDGLPVLCNPVLCNILYADVGSVHNAETGRFRAYFCHDCGHFFNAAFDERRLLYTQAYDWSLEYSARFVSFEEELAHRLNATYNLDGKLVIDVGCGKGSFLKRLCSLSGARGIGFDKGFEPSLGGVSPRVRFVND